jgi:tetratricopeptide (TPR) repeat protein
MMLTGLSACAASQGELERAERLAREGLALSRKVEDGEVILSATFCLAMVLRELGRFVESRSPHEERLAFCQNCGDRRREVNSLYSLSMTDRHLGSYAKAWTFAQAALALSRELGQTSDIGTACMELGRIALAEGAHEQASEWLQQSITAYEDAERPRISYQARVASVYVARALGRPSLARQHLLLALQMAARAGYRLLALESLPAVALLSLDGDRPGWHREEWAIELYALASRYPYVSNSRWFEDVAGREIRTAAEKLPSEVVAAARERGRARDLWATVEELLAKLAIDEPE